MWVFLNDAFVSIVWTDRCRDDQLLVRARRQKDIPRALRDPGIKPERTPGSDYLFRAVVPRALVVSAMAANVHEIGYGNFKDSIKDDALHTAAMQVWTAMSRLQPIPPYSTEPRPAAARSKGAKPRQPGKEAVNLMDALNVSLSSLRR